MNGPNLDPNMRLPYSVVATLNGASLNLPPGATANVAVQDASTASLTPDATAAPGTIASGFLDNVIAPPQQTVQNGINASVVGASNPDGSPVAPVSAPFTVGPAVTPPSGQITLSIVFGTPVPASGKSAPKPTSFVGAQ